MQILSPVPATLVALALLLPAGFASADRFTKIVEEGGESTATAGGYLVNHKRIAVQKELAQRPPTASELGLTLPPGSRLQLERTARQIAQYHPVWRIYEYQIDMPRTQFVEYFQKQGMRFDLSANHLKFGDDGEFIDGFYGDTMKSFRIWRRPQ